MSVNKIGVTACGVDAADDVCGGVVDPPFCMGDVLPFVVLCNAKLVYWAFGEIGDRGATARTLSGEPKHRMETQTITGKYFHGDYMRFMHWIKLSK